MNKRKISLFTLLFTSLFLTISLYSVELDFFWDAGDVFVNGQLDIKQDMDGVLNAGVRGGEVILNDNDSAFSLTLNPFLWNCKNHFNPSSFENRFTFLNLELSYDLFHFDKNNMNLGPYVSVNYLDLVNMNFKGYQIDLGFKYTYYSYENNKYYFKPEAFTLRSGFRMNDNVPSIFVEGSFNLAGFILGCLDSSYNEAKELKNKL